MVSLTTLLIISAGVGILGAYATNLGGFKEWVDKNILGGFTPVSCPPNLVARCNGFCSQFPNTKPVLDRKCSCTCPKALLYAAGCLI